MSDRTSAGKVLSRSLQSRRARCRREVSGREDRVGEQREEDRPWLRCRLALLGRGRALHGDSCTLERGRLALGNERETRKVRTHSVDLRSRRMLAFEGALDSGSKVFTLSYRAFYAAPSSAPATISSRPHLPSPSSPARPPHLAPASSCLRASWAQESRRPMQQRTPLASTRPLLPPYPDRSSISSTLPVSRARVGGFLLFPCCQGLSLSTSTVSICLVRACPCPCPRPS